MDQVRIFLVGTVTALAVTGCAVGPDYRPPAAPGVDRYTAEPVPLRTESVEVPGGEAQLIQPGADLDGKWWTLFGSAAIDALIERALGSYPDIAAQQAALSAAEEDLRAGRAVFLPQLQLGADATRSRATVATSFPGAPQFISNLFAGNVNVTYSFDLFGGERRAVEGLQAQALQRSFELEASYLTLTSNVVLAAIQFASLHDQISATTEIITLEDRQLAVVRRRFELGSQTQADVQQQQANVASVRASLPLLQQQLAVFEHQLAILTGRFPSEADGWELRLSELTLPRNLPVSLPSALVAQRPDIRAQEAIVRQASAAIGVATANMLPQLTLSGQSGTQAAVLANLFKTGSGIWSVGGALTQPLFAGGALRAKRRAAVDLYDEARAQYRLVVLQAFQNVADSLTAIDNDARALKAQREALDAAEAGLRLIQRQYEVGAVNYVSLLIVQQSYQQSRLGYVRALANRYADTAALFEALGGGWWHRHDLGIAGAE